MSPSARADDPSPPAGSSGRAMSALANRNYDPEATCRPMSATPRAARRIADLQGRDLTEWTRRTVSWYGFYHREAANRLQRTGLTGQGYVATTDRPGGPQDVPSSFSMSLNGQGLQVFLATFHVVQLKFELNDLPTTTFAVVSSATPSEHNLVDTVGMDTWDPPRQVVEARAAAGVPFIAGKRVIAADDAAVARAFSAMRSWHMGGNVFRCPKTDAPIRIDCGWFEPSVLQIG